MWASFFFGLTSTGQLQYPLLFFLLPFFLSLLAPPPSKEKKRLHRGWFRGILFWLLIFFFYRTSLKRFSVYRNTCGAMLIWYEYRHREYRYNSKSGPIRPRQDGATKYTRHGSEKKEKHQWQRRNSPQWRYRSFGKQSQDGVLFLISQNNDMAGIWINSIIFGNSSKGFSMPASKVKRKEVLARYGMKGEMGSVDTNEARVHRNRLRLRGLLFWFWWRCLQGKVSEELFFLENCPEKKRSASKDLDFLYDLIFLPRSPRLSRTSWMRPRKGKAKRLAAAAVAALLLRRCFTW